MVASKPVARIEDWTFVEVDDGSCLIGRVFDHPRIPDGHWTITSLIETYSRLEAESTNTLYRLGEPMSKDTDVKRLAPSGRVMLADSWDPAVAAKFSDCWTVH